MSDWETCTLEDACEIFDGPHATPEKQDSGPHFLSISSLQNGHLDLSESAFISEEDYSEWTRRVVPRHEDIVFSYETRLGQAAMIPNGLRCCLGRRMGLLRSKDRSFADPNFLLHYYLGDPFQKVIKNNTVFGTTVDRIPLQKMGGFEIALPPLPEQKRIASVLTSVDEAIETTQKQINKLQGLKKATTNALLTTGTDHKEFKESELGRIPNGWESVALEEFCEEIVVGHVGSTSEHYTEKDGVRFIRTGDLKDGKIRLTETKQITREFHLRLKKSSLRSGDVLVSRVGDTGQAALVPEGLGEANCANIIIIRCGEKLLPQFLKLFINSELFFDQVTKVSIGSAQAVLNIAIIKQLLISLPSQAEQVRICQAVNNLEDLIGNQEQKLNRTQSLKKSLMQDLLTGRVRMQIN